MEITRKADSERKRQSAVKRGKASVARMERSGIRVYGFGAIRGVPLLRPTALLLLVACCGCWATGYAAGATGKRAAFSQALLPILITVVISILVDFDATRRGLIGVSQQSLVLLKQSVSPPQPKP
jgi:hypothetical protein